METYLDLQKEAEQHTLESTDATSFIAQFAEKTNGLPIEIVAMMVWNLSNAQWTKGYEQGKYNPDFDETT